MVLIIIIKSKQQTIAKVYTLPNEKVNDPENGWIVQL